MLKIGKQALTFDDVLIQPANSNVLPDQVDLKSSITSDISLKIPLMAAAMDTVSEAPMAIAMAQLGAIAVLHRNMDADMQASHVRQVKRFESGMVVNPITIESNKTLADAQALMARHGITGIPVLAPRSKKLVGILTNRDVRFAGEPLQKVSELMTKRNLVTVPEHISRDDARRLLHRHRIEKLLVCDDKKHCIGLITVRDIERSTSYPQANKDAQGRLMVAAAIGVGTNELERAQTLIHAGCDLLVVDTAHGQSDKVLRHIEKLKKIYPQTPVMGGNVATPSGTQALIDAGCDAVKIGIGPGSICTTRIIAGIGVPQLSAIMECHEIAKKYNVAIIGDGGIKFSGDIAKAIAGGASAVMVGSLLAGTDESPGEVFLFQGRSYKSYRGMGSMSAMAKGSANRYFQEKVEDHSQYISEGVEGRVPVRGAVSGIVQQLMGGLRASMGYIGCKTIAEMQEKAVLRPITNAGLKESHVHDITLTREPPNYRIS
ncbi:MAG: IMP dehydrogenase [Pseudomonadota bacterium]